MFTHDPVAHFYKCSYITLVSKKYRESYNIREGHARRIKDCCEAREYDFGLLRGRFWSSSVGFSPDLTVREQETRSRRHLHTVRHVAGMMVKLV